MNGDSQNLLQFEIKNIKPVSAEDYASALLAVADEYQQFLSLHYSVAEVPTSKLFVSGVENGSIISTLTPAIAGTLPLIGSIQTVMDYAEYLAALVDWTLGKTLRPPVADERKTLKNVGNIVKPTVHDQGAQMNIGSMTFNGAVSVAVNIGSQDAERVSAFVRHRLESLRESKPSGLKESVLLYWFQTRNAVNNKAGDRAMIDSIWSEPVNVRFATDELKRMMVLEADNPYQHGYIVDVNVMTVNDKPVLYQVERLLDVIDLPA